MKIYTQTIELAQPTNQKFWTPQHSDFALGLKVLKNGEAVDYVLKKGSETLTPQEAKIGGFDIFEMSSTTEGGEEFTVEANGQTVKIQHITSDSTVFDIDKSGSTYNLPVATTETLGGIKVGANLSIDENGVLDALGGEIPADLSVDNLSAISDNAKIVVKRPTGRMYLNGNNFTMYNDEVGGYIGMNCISSDTAGLMLQDSKDPFSVQKSAKYQLNVMTLQNGTSSATAKQFKATPEKLQIKNVLTADSNGLKTNALNINNKQYSECVLSGAFDDDTTFNFVVLSANA